MPETPDPLDEFRDQCRRNIGRPIDQHIRYGFCYVYKPVLDDADYRVFDTMEEYRLWCHEHLPSYLGYKLREDDETAFGVPVGVNDA